MSLSIDVLVPVKSGASGGFIKHLAEVLPRWAASNRVREFTVYAPAGVAQELARLGVRTQPVAADDFAHGFREMAALVGRSRADVVLNTSSRPVKVAGKPLVTMVQNIEPVQRAIYPMSLRWRLRMWLLRRETARACRQSTRVIAVSQGVKDELRRRWGLQDVDVVYHGFELEPRADRPGRALPERFIFSAGSIVPYRGYEDVIEAVAALRRSGFDTPPVLIAGSPVGLSVYCEKMLKRLAARRGVEDLVIWLGNLSAAEMAWCYQHAAVFVQTSRAEACPNILLEAMGNGAAVVSCTQPPMPEILGDAAIYYPTGNASALAEVLRKVLSLPPEELAARQRLGRQRVAAFDWGQTAERTLDVLEAALAGRASVSTGIATQP